MSFLEELKLIESEAKGMEADLIKLSNINSHSYNLKGLNKIRQWIIKKFKELEKKSPNLKLQIEELPLSPQKVINLIDEERKLAPALKITKINSNEKAKKILLMGHLDTVYQVDSSFQVCKKLDENILNGPGVADLKGGIIVLIKALEHLEKNSLAEKISWEVFFNTDEEIGSPGSKLFFQDLAKNHKIALLYEPSLSDGSIAWQRKGTGNFYIKATGKAAHVGRDFRSGTNAILALVQFINKADELNGSEDKLIINFGKIEGGGPLNVVPDSALLSINIRVKDNFQADLVIEKFNKIITYINEKKDTKLELIGSFNREPKIPNKKLEDLYKAINDCAKDLKLNLTQKDTGGCCDGNNLWGLGLTNIDTLGARGDFIHSHQEIVYLDSLVERSKLSALFLLRLARGDFDYVCS